MPVSYSPSLSVSDSPAKGPDERFFVGGGGASTPLVVIQDTFTNDTASAVDLDAHTPDVDNVGGGWTVTDGDGSAFTGTQDVLTNDTFRFLGGDTSSLRGIARIDSGVTTGVAAETVAVAGQYSRWVKFLTRYVDTDNCFILSARVYDGGGNAEAYIHELTGGTLTQRAVDLTAGSSPSPGDLDRIWFQDNGTRLSIGFVQSDGTRLAEALGYDSATHFGSSIVGLSDSALGASIPDRCDIDSFTVISTPDYTQLP